MKNLQHTRKNAGYVLALFLILNVSVYGQLTYKTTWVANTGGTWKTFTQMYIYGAGVSQAGMTAGVCNWDEGGRGLGLYNNDGNVVNLEWNDRGAGYMVAINLNFVYNSWGNAIEKRPVTKTTQVLKKVSLNGISSVSANELFVVATLNQQNKVNVYDADLNLLRSINVGQPSYATPDNNGNVWVIRRNNNAPQVVEFDATGTATGKVINGLSDPHSLQISKKGQLIIGDNGINKQVFFYDISGSPSLAKTVGQKGGISAGIPGEIKPDKFNGIIYAGTDSLNNLYVITNREGAIIRKFNSTDEQVWQKYGLAFVDMADADPENENHIYSAEEKYIMDYSKENGKEQTYAACLLDQDKYPEDPRIHQSLDGGVWIRRINGQKFMFVGEMYSGFIFIYRFNESTDGEIAIPSGAIMNHTSQQWGSTEWPAYQPKVGAVIWRDKNGNGKFEADEYESVPYELSYANVDDNANVYVKGSLDYFECIGLDNIGNPIYSFKNKKSQVVPKEFYLVKKVVYDNTRDVMFITGNSQDLSNEFPVGPCFASYPNWSKGNRKAAWIKTYNENYTGFAAKNEYFFAGYSLDNSSIDVFSAKDGAKVGNMAPQQLERFGWIDIPWGLNVTQRANGEYLVFREDDYVAKTVIQRWNPYSNDAENPGKPTGLNLLLATPSSAIVSYNRTTDITGLAGYNLYANGIKNNSLAVWDSTYTYTNLLPDTDYTLYVAAVDFAGHETKSESITIKTAPTDNTKPLAPLGLQATDVTTALFTVKWNSSSDNVGIKGYELFLNNTKVGYKLIQDTVFTFTDLMSNYDYSVKLVAYDYSGNISDTSTCSVKTLVDYVIPTAPKMIPTTIKSSSEIALIWASSTDNVKVESYNIYQNGNLLKDKISASEYMGIPISGDFMDYKITGLKPDSTYNLSVRAVDKAGNLSEISNALTVKTDRVWSQLLDFEEADLSKMGHNLYYGFDIDACGFVAGFMKAPGSIEWSVNVPTDTVYRLITRYVTLEGFTYSMQIYVNGINTKAFTLKKLPSMLTWGHYQWDPGFVLVRLKAGNNKIRLTSLSNFAPNLDLMKIEIAPYDPTGITTLLKREINVYPNPVVGNELIVDLKDVVVKDNLQIQLFNILSGLTMKVEIGKASSGNIFEINTSSLSNGVYLLKIVSGKEVITRKIIIAK